MKIDEVDIHIIQELSRESRLSMRELAKKVNLSAPSVTERVKKLESTGVIKNYTVTLDLAKIGLPVQCLVEVIIHQGLHEKFIDYVKTYPFVEFCYRTLGHASFIVKLTVPSLENVEYFINKISDYGQTETHVILTTVDVKKDIQKKLEK
ncbi:Lrp/AsnC family transcriptional regulator [Massilibacterium senegalense]|uniref:Lrp/AsnC family transcriptional regulator n=1 Tax=Massilibacterium senegalense TaxID=1632858 RepID=UPI000780E133|nr:Lrp/AsnC family transcriptional regulator [Massilibacterium senegalense]